MLNNNIGRNLRSSFPSIAVALGHAIGDQLDKHPLKMFVNDGSTPRPDAGGARTAMFVDVLEDRKAEPDELFVRLGYSRQFSWMHRAEHVLHSADKQVILVIEMTIER